MTPEEEYFYFDVIILRLLHVDGRNAAMVIYTHPPQAMNEARYEPPLEAA